MSKLECFIAPPDRELEFMQAMSRSPSSWTYIQRKFTDLDLETVLSSDTSALYEYIKRWQKKHKEQMERTRDGFVKKWSEIEGNYFDVFLAYFGLDNFEHDMKAYVSILPIYPRDLKHFEFNINDRDVTFSIAIAMHEILHFLYFKKWKKLFPEHGFETYNEPHLVWFLSEILAPIILNNYPASQKLFKHEHMTYREFNKRKIGAKSVNEHFRDLFLEHLENETNTDDFLRLAWSEARKHEASIRGN